MRGHPKYYLLQHAVSYNLLAPYQLMKTESVTDIVLQNYSFKKEKPAFTSNNYTVYLGTQTETNLPVTIKILRQFHLEMPKYLKKLKDCKSDNVIKVYEAVSDNSCLVFVTERVGYGNLGDSLLKCENRLDQADSIFMAKQILNGHVDLLRSDCNWFGTERDIEFTDSGVKLSWNNSIGYNLVNPIPKILQKIALRPEEATGDINLLPFPKSKVILELIRVSKENASEISLNPQMKKKDKLSKKKGKDWIALKEYRNKNEYFDESSFLGVSSEHGVVKIKIYEEGKIDPEILALNKTKRTSTKVIETYNENGKTIIISEYSNDGNLQAYVTRLKSSGISLSEDHIEFFFYSLFEPLKQVQMSPLKSINMLHIKNIYIENGIPKIGEPVPLNSNIEAILVDRAEVPDFYHTEFKKNPSTHNETYDTYSLGVLLYKLMYTEYPIFPNGKVHIPTTPNYNKRLKTTLEIFLNEGGKLKEIESRIEVSENVLKQVQVNKEKLVVKKANKNEDKNTGRALLEDASENENEKESKSDGEQVSAESEDGDEIGCCALCCTKLELTANEAAANKSIGIVGLEESPYKIYRICTKIILSLLLYIFLFYFFFLRQDTLLMASQDLLTTYNVTIATVNYPIITTDANKFQTSFGPTAGTLDDLLSMNCLINNYDGNPDYSEFLHENSSGWVAFVVCALLAMVGLLILKIWQIYNFDVVKAIYDKEHAKFQFNMSHFVIFNLQWACLVYGHFYFFNFVFNGQTEPCVGGEYSYASTEALFNDRAKFSLVYTTTFVLQFVVAFLSALMIGYTHRVKYNKLINPIMLFGPLIATQWVIMRVGPINGYFYPNIIQDGHIIRGYFASLDYLNVLGIIPEILIALELVLGFLVDLIYWMFLDKRRRLLINETSNASLGEP